MFSQARDLNSEAQAKFAGAGTAVAGGAGSGDEVVGQTIDRRAGGGIFTAGVALFSAVATLGADETLDLGITLQESDDGSTWGTAETVLESATVATGGEGGSTETYELKVAYDLSGRKRYVRFNMTPELSAEADDVAAVAGSFFMMGGQKLPTS